MDVDAVFLPEYFVGLSEHICFFLVVKFAGLAFVAC